MMNRLNSPLLPRRHMRCLVAVAMVLVGLPVLCGCRSLSHYVSPQVVGRVLDSKTLQPSAGVKVQRVVPDYEAGTLEQARGGEMLEMTRPPESKADGTFVLPSQKSIALFRDIAWFTVELSLTHRYYDKYLTNYTPRSATNTLKGEPVIYTGDILMTPKSK
jgi:hypothetical protein